VDARIVEEWKRAKNRAFVKWIHDDCRNKNLMISFCPASFNTVHDSIMAKYILCILHFLILHDQEAKCEKDCVDTAKR